MKLGIPEGRRVGLLLDQVRRLQLDGIITSRGGSGGVPALVERLTHSRLSL